LRAPLIVQTSVKTVKSIGLRPLFAMFRAYAEPAPIPIALHLDHCPDRAVITACLKQGYNSVLFDGSHLPSVEENKRQTIEVVAEARAHGAHVEGEIEGILGVEDGLGSDLAADIYSLETAVDFVKSTGVDVFAPAIGNAHGVYKAPPVLDVQRVSDIVAQVPVPICLHGGTGLSAAQVVSPIPLGIALGLFIGKPLGIYTCARVAISSGIGAMPAGASQVQLFGTAILGGIGFTMSLFIGMLAFHGPLESAEVRVGVLAGSLMSAVVGYLVLARHRTV